MARRPWVPASLRHGPFTRSQALAAGLTSRQLQGQHVVRVLPQVWVLREHRMTELDRIVATDLATPDDARISHASRLRRLGLLLGNPHPVHLLVPRDLHLQLPGTRFHQRLVSRGYSGPAPVFGLLWDALFRPARAWVRHQPHRDR